MLGGKPCKTADYHVFTPPKYVLNNPVLLLPPPPPSKDKTEEIMIHQGVGLAESLFRPTHTHARTLDCHTDLDFLQSWRCGVVGRAFLLCVLEILLVQLFWDTGMVIWMLPRVWPFCVYPTTLTSNTSLVVDVVFSLVNLRLFFLHFEKVAYTFSVRRCK